MIPDEILQQQLVTVTKKNCLSGGRNHLRWPVGLIGTEILVITNPSGPFSVANQMF